MLEHVITNNSKSLGCVSFISTELNNFTYEIRLSYAPKNPGQDQ